MLRPFALTAFLAIQAAAQQPAPVSVRGVTWDSLRGAPLGGAFVAIAGTDRAATSDARGRFRIDSVVPGTHVFTMQHDVLDSIGFSGRSVRAAVAGTSTTVSIATPSFASLWKAACGGVPPKDSALVYGTVLNAAGQPAPNARVTVNWLDLSYERRTGLKQQAWGGEVRADSSGRYALCGVPADVGLQLRAVGDAGALSVVELAPRTMRVGRRDLHLSAAADSTSDAGRGTIVGTLIAEGGRPVEGAIVVTAGLSEERSSADGGFVFRNVPAGTRQIEVRYIGTSPVATVVDVVAGDTARVSIELTRVQTLSEVNVTAQTVRQIIARGIDERRMAGLGYHRDSLTIAKAHFMGQAFDGVSGLKVIRVSASNFKLESSRPRCRNKAMAVWVDRIRLSAVELGGYNPADIAAIEIYPGGLTTPPEFMAREGRDLTCGAVVVWTKNFLAK